MRTCWLLKNASNKQRQQHEVTTSTLATRSTVAATSTVTTTSILPTRPYSTRDKYRQDNTDLHYKQQQQRQLQLKNVIFTTTVFSTNFLQRQLARSLMPIIKSVFLEAVIAWRPSSHQPAASAPACCISSATRLDNRVADNAMDNTADIGFIVITSFWETSVHAYMCDSSRGLHALQDKTS